MLQCQPHAEILVRGFLNLEVLESNGGYLVHAREEDKV